MRLSIYSRSMRFEMLLLARTCLGLAAGLFTVSVPAMIAEGLPKKKAEAAGFEDPCVSCIPDG